MKDELKKDIVASQQEMKATQDEMKDELKASLIEEIKVVLSIVESEIDSIEVQVYGIEKKLGEEITDIKKWSPA